MIYGFVLIIYLSAVVLASSCSFFSKKSPSSTKRINGDRPLAVSVDDDGNDSIFAIHACEVS